MIERCEKAFETVWLHCVARLKQYGIDRDSLAAETVQSQSHAR
jgi:hypothetical protein